MKKNISRRQFIKSTGRIAGASLIGTRLLDSSVSSDDKPNIIYILADDMGYGEPGCYGQKLIQTPHIDHLAESGMIFTDHYSGSPVCAPSRCSLLTGKHTGHAFIRGNHEWDDRGDVWDYHAMEKNPELEGQYPIPGDTVTIGKLLKKAGYRTACIGKWGLGAPRSEGAPSRQGFDFFYGYNCQRQAHTYFPGHLWKNETRVILKNRIVPPHTGFKKGADPLDENSYAEYSQPEYAPALMQREAVKFIEKNKNSPFFLYYASPIPHLPLQAPKKYIDRYHKIFGNEEPYTGKSYFPCRYPRATYAAMITILDQQVGEIINTLKRTGQYRNTLVIFSSDNGPTYTGGADTEFFDSGGIFGEKYGRGKGFTHEGGIRIPMISSWPGQIRPRSTTGHISAFYDVLPTLCDVAGITPPKDTDGISFLPTLLNNSKQHEHEYLYWEFPEYGGQQAVRMGKWKGIRKNIFKGNKKTELYNLEEDPGEVEDLSVSHRKIVEIIERIFTKAHRVPKIKKFNLFKES